MSEPLDLRAVEAYIHDFPVDDPTVGERSYLLALLAHARALRAVLRLGRDLLMEHHEHLGAAEEVFNDWDEQARAVLAAAQDGPA